jgi:hypothetical protein
MVAAARMRLGKASAHSGTSLQRFTQRVVSGPPVGEPTLGTGYSREVDVTLEVGRVSNRSELRPSTCARRLA